MEEVTCRPGRRIRATTAAAAAVVLLVAIPFWAGAITLAMDAFGQSAATARAGLCQGAMFSLGLAVGLTGAAMVMTGRSDRSRALATAGVLMGFALVSLALTMSWYVTRATAARPISPLPFSAPSAMVFGALFAASSAFRGPGQAEEEDESAAATTNLIGDYDQCTQSTRSKSATS